MLDAARIDLSKYRLERGMPFESKLPVRKPIAIGSLSREQLDSELQKGHDSVLAGQGYTEKEVDEIFEREFGV